MKGWEVIWVLRACSLCQRHVFPTRKRMMEQSNWELLFGNWEGKLGWEAMLCVEGGGEVQGDNSGQWASALRGWESAV